MKHRKSGRKARMTLFDKKPSVMLIVAVILGALIPLLSGGFFYVQARSTVEQQQKELARASVDMGHQYIDIALQDLTVTAIRLSGQLRNLSMPPIAHLSAAERLKFNESSLIMRDAMYSELVDIRGIYLYSTAHQYAIGDQGMCDAEVIRKKYYETVEPEQIDAIHHTAYTGRLIRLGDRMQAFVRTAYKAVDGTPEKQLIILLSNGFFERRLAEVNVSGGIFALISQKGDVLAVDAGGREVAIEDLGHIALTKAGETVQFPGQDTSFYAYRKALSMSGYELVGLIPMESLMDGARMLDIFFWTVMGLAACIVAVLIFTATRRSVLPIGKLIHYISSNYTGDGDQSLEEIQRSVERMVEERREREEQMQSYEEERQQHLLRQMLAGSQRGDAQLAQWTGQNYAVVCFYAPEESEISDATLRELVEGALGRLLPQGTYSRTLMIRPYAVAVLSGETLTIEDTARWIEQCLAWIDERSSHVLIASISALHTKDDSLDTAYNEANMAMEYAITQPDPAMTRFDECEFKGELFLRDFHHIDKQLKFSTLVSEEELGLAERQLEELFPEEFTRVIPPESSMAVLHLQSLKYQFLHDIDHLTYVMELELDTRNALIGQILYCDSHRKLYAVMKKLFEDMGERSPAEPFEPIGVQEIKRYIEENYKNPLLSVAMIAERFGLSANGLSKLFGRKSDVSVLSYIHKVRVEAAARKMLENRTSTIQSIAESVGYTSLLTFNRRFKVVFQVTPSEYRREHDSQIS